MSFLEFIPTLKLNIKFQISPLLLETNAYKFKSMNNNYAVQNGP